MNAKSILFQFFVCVILLDQIPIYIFKRVWMHMFQSLEAVPLFTIASTDSSTHIIRARRIHGMSTVVRHASFPVQVVFNTELFLGKENDGGEYFLSVKVCLDFLFIFLEGMTFLQSIRSRATVKARYITKGISSGQNPE